jgi:hypothetical protein
LIASCNQRALARHIESEPPRVAIESSAREMPLMPEQQIVHFPESGLATGAFRDLRGLQRPRMN